jgi:hypothetical protein
MTTLAEIKSAADSLPAEQKEELLRFLADRLRPAEEAVVGRAVLVDGPSNTLLLEAPHGAPPMSTETVKRMLEDFP